MKKIPSIFMRNHETDKKLRDEINPEARWVFDGEGVATRKYDGTCCMIRDGKLYKRRELKSHSQMPPNWEAADGVDLNTGKRMGWVPVGDENEDRRHREAFARLENKTDGTYELVGPDVSKNPEYFEAHTLYPHAEAEVYADCPRYFNSLVQWLQDKDIEGVVWHHPDGRMAKIKKSDLRLKRVPIQVIA